MEPTNKWKEYPFTEKSSDEHELWTRPYLKRCTIFSLVMFLGMLLFFWWLTSE